MLAIVAAGLLAGCSHSMRSPDVSGDIRKALAELGAPPERLRFETAPQLVGGIELTTNGQKLAWSIAEYLRSLEHSVGDVIADQLKAPPVAAGAGAAAAHPP